MPQYICGKQSVIDAFENNFPIECIFSLEKNSHNFGAISVHIVSKQELDRLTNNLNHQGIAAQIKDFNYYDIEVINRDKPEIVLMLDHIQDPQNLGAIMRSANAAGVQHLVIPRDRVVDVTATVLKTSSGGFVGMKVIKTNSLFNTLTNLKKIGYWIYVSSLGNDALPINQITWNKPLVLVVGNEKSGVSPTLQKIADQKAFIPMKGTVQSLNVSVATGIFLFAINKEV